MTKKMRKKRGGAQYASSLLHDTPQFLSNVLMTGPRLGARTVKYLSQSNIPFLPKTIEEEKIIKLTEELLSKNAIIKILKQNHQIPI